MFSPKSDTKLFSPMYFYLGNFWLHPTTLTKAGFVTECFPYYHSDFSKVHPSLLMVCWSSLECGVCLLTSKYTLKWLHGSRTYTTETDPEPLETSSVHHPVPHNSLLCCSVVLKPEGSSKGIWQIWLATASYSPESYLAQHWPISSPYLGVWQPTSHKAKRERLCK